MQQKIHAKQYSLQTERDANGDPIAVVRSRSCVTGIVRTLAAFRGLASVDALFLRFSCMSVSGGVPGMAIGLGRIFMRPCYAQTDLMLLEPQDRERNPVDFTGLLCFRAHG